MTQDKFEKIHQQIKQLLHSQKKRCLVKKTTRMWIMNISKNKNDELSLNIQSETEKFLEEN